MLLNFSGFWKSRKAGRAGNMRVLHYMFGLPPVRAGGLVRYATDLMVQEMRMGEDVRLLIPGVMSMDARRAPQVYKYNINYMHIPTYAVRDPLPVPMCNGIIDTAAYTKKCEDGGFGKFLCRIRPDVIHVHTFMGLHQEFLAKARGMGIPVVFTSHDYFGICPTALMAFKGHICRDTAWEMCGWCSRDAFPRWRLRMEQSRPYRMFRKQEWLVGLLKKAAGYMSFGCPGTHLVSRGVQMRYGAEASVSRNVQIRSGTETSVSRDAQICSGTETSVSWDNRIRPAAGLSAACADYPALREYYASMFQLVSYFHFNSTLAERIYRLRLNGLGEMKGSVAGISCLGVMDCRRKRSFGKTLRIGYVGSWTKHKGFFDLLEACGRIRDAGYTNLELHVYSSTDKRNECFVRNHPGFDRGQLKEVFDGMDVLAVPSRCPETFGLAVLEALSFGVPVILSRYVGAGDILDGNPDGGFIYDGTVSGLKKILEKICRKRELLEEANAAILRMDYDFSHEGHVRKILDIYRSSKNI